ncbi:NADP-dependent oxidoreductase domain-containing protein [Aspergillus carlsbadensis]|nr:NADP-dependent oxidoreductase domain-containing protein [Aspergillus carlsbadensis]
MASQRDLCLKSFPLNNGTHLPAVGLGTWQGFGSQVEVLRIDESPTFVETWKKMEACVGDKCRAIGVSNFTQKTLNALLEAATIVPVVNQVELHVFNPNHRLVPYCQEKGIHVMSWSTMGGGAEHSSRLSQILTHPVFKGIAERHNCSTGVVSLSWAVQRGITVIPKSSSLARLDENIRLVTLDDEAMAIMDNAHRTIALERIADNIQAIKRVVDGKETILGWTAQDFGWEDAEGNWLT